MIDREQVAIRLMNLLKDGDWLTVADEVIRLMEAAWCQGAQAGEDMSCSCGYSLERALANSYPDQGPLRGSYPLDPPPDDWTPGPPATKRRKP